MDATPAVSDLYVPYYLEEKGHSQPIATALSLNAGKNLCHEHFLKRCRTLKQLLPPQQQTEIPATLLDHISLEWSASPSGVYEGKPEGCRDTALGVLTDTVYKLHPTG
jgi:hypothetical protein